MLPLSPPPPQVPSDAEEADRKDEALAPSDMNCITGTHAELHLELHPELHREVQ
jgi:hypothetical protein